MLILSRSMFMLIALWLAMLAVVMLLRPYLPVDETRYLAVAWEMWQRGEFLLPYLNGEPYSHKPPLLFWLIHLGWWMFGVSDWWPRVMIASLSVINLVLTQLLARQLWPNDIGIARQVPWLLFGFAGWMLFTGLIQFDLLLTSFVLLGMLFAIHWWRHAAPLALLGLVISFAGGMFTKGPVIYAHLLPTLLLAPLFLQGNAVKKSTWYSSILAAALIGGGSILFWALPAASLGGQEFADAIFWHQTTDRITQGITHPQPWWWYLVFLPVLFFPWIWMSPIWKIRHCDTGMRWVILWLLSSLLIFSCIGEKQLKYLLPLLPAYALFAAALFTQFARSMQRLALVVLLLLALLGGVLAALPFFALSKWPAWVATLSPGWGAALCAGALGVLLVVMPRPQLRGWGVVGVTAMSWFVLHFSVIRSASPYYDLAEMSWQVAAYEQAGVSILNTRRYHGQYHFLGRLKQPIDVAIMGADMLAWVDANPAGRVITYYDEWRAELTEIPVYSQPYRGGAIVIWRADQVQKNPQWLLQWP